MEDLVTVIVPVYNTARYLKKCLDSLIGQTYSNLEIIVVNDGSTDNSLFICNEYANTDNRIKVVTKQNAGLGMARNTGLEHTTGKYVSFIDSDDCIEKDMIFDLYKLTIANEVDIIISQFIYNGIIMRTPIQEGIYRNSDIKTIVLPHMLGNSGIDDAQLSVSACAKLYRKAVIKDNGIEFPSERKLIWEDFAFNIRLFKHIDSVYVSKNAYYHYDYNPESLTHKYIPDKLKQVMVTYQYLQEALREYDLSSSDLLRLDNTILGHIRTCLKLEAFYSKENGVKKAIANTRAICKNPDVQRIVSAYPIENLSMQQKIYSLVIKNRHALLVFSLAYIQNLRKKII